MTRPGGARFNKKLTSTGVAGPPPWSPLAIGAVVALGVRDLNGWVGVTVAFMGYGFCFFRFCCGFSFVGLAVLSVVVGLCFVFQFEVAFNVLGILIGGCGFYYLFGGGLHKLAVSSALLTRLKRLSPLEKNVLKGVGSMAVPTIAYFQFGRTQDKSVESIIITQPDGTKYEKVTVYEPSKSLFSRFPKKKGSLVLVVPTDSDLFPEFGTVIFFYVFCLFCVYYLLKRFGPRFEHPLKSFVPAELLDHPGVNYELERFSLFARAALSHTVSLFMSTLLGVFYYFGRFIPSLLVPSQRRFQTALQESLFLQVEKLNYLDGRVDPSMTEHQRKLLRDTIGLYNDSVKIMLPEVPLPEFPLVGWSFLLLLVLWVSVQRRKTDARLVLFIPELTKIPTPVWVRLIVPVGLIFLGGWAWSRWRQSGKSPQEYTTEVLLSHGVDGLVNLLRKVRLLTVLSPLGSVSLAVMNLFIVGSTFVSHRFSDLNGSTLKGCTPSEGMIENSIHQRYLSITDRVLELEVELLKYHPDGVDPFGELWWISLSRPAFFVVGAGVVGWWWWRGSK